MLVAVAVVKDKKGSVAGLRLAELDDSKKGKLGNYRNHNCNTKDISMVQVKGFLQNGGKISGVELHNGTPRGSNGAFDRYGSPKAKDKQPLVIIQKLGDEGFVVCDVNGMVCAASSATVVSYAEKFGIANGKVVEKDGNKFISAISGEYERIDTSVELKLEDTDGVQDTADVIRRLIEKAANSDPSSLDTSRRAALERAAAQGLLPSGVTASGTTLEADDIEITPELGRQYSMEDADVARVNKEHGAEGLNVMGVNLGAVQTDANGQVIIPTQEEVAKAVAKKIKKVMRGEEGIYWTDGDLLLDTEHFKNPLTVAQKIALAQMTLKQWNPFIYAMTKEINFVPCGDRSGVDTAGVSKNSLTLYYNCKYIQAQPMGAVIGLMIHEIYHLLERHTLRGGKREHSRWNKACDFYINRQIAHEFNMDNNPFMEKSLTDSDLENCDFVPNAKLINSGAAMSRRIALPVGGLYEKTVDIIHDTPESIYDEICAETDMPESQAGDEGEGDGDEGEGSGAGGKGKGKNKSSSGKGSGRGSSSSGGSDDEEDDGDGEDKGGGSGGGDDGEGGTSGDGNSKKKKRPDKFRGKEYPDGDEDEGDGYDSDIVDDDTGTGNEMDDEKRLRDDLKRAVATAANVARQMGRGLSPFADRAVNELLIPQIDFRSLLRLQMNMVADPQNSWKRPGRRGELAPGIPSPGRIKNEVDGIEKAIVAIDTSGSISDRDLQLAYGAIYKLCSQMKVDVEVVFWDSDLQKVVEMKDIKDILKEKPTGGGGTDVKLVFEYAAGKRAVGKHKFQGKAKVIIIITDGAVFNDYGSYSRVAESTLWLLNDKQAALTFRPLFGKVAPLALPNE